MDNYSKIFADNLRHFRKEMKLTQEQLADRLGYTEKAISKWEQGASIPPADTLIILADALNVSLDDLFSHTSQPTYYLGVDGGATKTAFVLADSDGNVIKEVTLGPSNPFDIGFDAATEILTQGINEITANVRKKKISFYAGISGGGTPDMKEKFRVFFESFGFLRTDNGSDAENIIAAGLRGEDGAIIIMGTGSSCFVSIGGNTNRIGGLGYLFDHGGSGYDIGNNAIKSALSAEDKSGKPTLIRDYILEETGFSNALSNLSYFYSIGKSGIASFSPVVFKAYDNGDEVAGEILDRNMSHIAHLAKTTLEYFKGNENPVKIAIVGGLTKQWDILYPMIEKHLKINGAYDRVNLQVFIGDVVQGALIKAGAPIKYPDM